MALALSSCFASSCFTCHLGILPEDVHIAYLANSSVLVFAIDAWRPGSIHSQGQPCAAAPQQFEHVPACCHFCYFVRSIQP